MNVRSPGRRQEDFTARELQVRSPMWEHLLPVLAALIGLVAALAISFAVFAYSYTHTEVGALQNRQADSVCALARDPDLYESTRVRLEAVCLRAAEAAPDRQVPQPPPPRP